MSTQKTQKAKPRCSTGLPPLGRHFRLFSQVLPSRGADTAIYDSFGCTYLHFLNYNSAEDHIRTLLSTGGDMNKARSIDERTPLMCALYGWVGSKLADWPEYMTK